MGLTLNQGRPEAYIEEMRYSYGDKGEELAREVMAGRGEGLFMRYPLVERVLDSSLAVVGFNTYMCDRIRATRADIPVRYLPYQFYLPKGFPREFDGASLRQKLGLQDVPVVASLGLFTAQKRLGIALEAFQRLLALHPDAVYLLVGAPDAHYAELRNRLDSMGLGERVRLTGWLPPREFTKYMLVADLAVQLRYPHVGGTPYTPIRLLGLGVPTVISDIGPLADLPADCLVRVEPNMPGEETYLLAAMDYLLTHRDVARALGRNGQVYVCENHDLRWVANRLADFMQEIAARRGELGERVRSVKAKVDSSSVSYDGLVQITASALAGMGISLSDSSYSRSIAKAICDLTSGSSQKAANDLVGPADA
jgi:glycosyltransferase involved in cell wall biosynthesis